MFSCALLQKAPSGVFLISVSQVRKRLRESRPLPHSTGLWIHLARGPLAPAFLATTDPSGAQFQAGSPTTPPLNNEGSDGSVLRCICSGGLLVETSPSAMVFALSLQSCPLVVGGCVVRSWPLLRLVPVPPGCQIAQGSLPSSVSFLASQIQLSSPS